MMDALKNPVDTMQPSSVHLRVFYNASRVFWQFKMVEKCIEALSDLTELLETLLLKPDTIDEGLNLNQVRET